MAPPSAKRRKKAGGVRMNKLPKGVRWKSPLARKRMLEHIHEHHPRMSTAKMTPEWWKKNITGSISKLLATCTMCDAETWPFVFNIQRGQGFACKCLPVPKTFEQSFASYDGKAPDGITLKRDCLVDRSINPRSVYRSCNGYFEFKCPDPKCGHVWPTTLNMVTCSRSRWCPYCAGKKLCPGSKNCKVCIAKSFASYDGKAPCGTLKRDCLVGDVDARSVFKSSTSKKYNFKCPDPKCGKVWPTTLKHVTSDGNWCPVCKKKTETFVQKTILQIYKDDPTTTVDPRQGQIPVDGLKRRRKWDHRVTRYADGETHVCNAETDGDQHTNKSNRWSTDKSRASDVEKQIAGRDAGQSLVRLDQEWVWRNKDKKWMPAVIKAMFEAAFEAGPGTLVLLDVHYEKYVASGLFAVWDDDCGGRDVVVVRLGAFV